MTLTAYSVRATNYPAPKPDPAMPRVFAASHVSEPVEILTGKVMAKFAKQEGHRPKAIQFRPQGGKDLNETCEMVMAELSKHDGIRAKELSRCLGLHADTVSYHLHRDERAKMTIEEFGRRVWRIVK